MNGKFLDELTFRSEQIADGIRAIADQGSIDRDAAFATNGHTVESELDSSLSREVQHKAVVEIVGNQVVESDIDDKEAFINRPSSSRASNFGLISYQVEHAGEDFEAQAPLVA